MEKRGAKIDIEGGYVIARAKDGLKGGDIKFQKVTVSGTHTALMAAVLARGTTVIENAAQEPEIGDVADCLNKMGARISGIGTSRLIVEGVNVVKKHVKPNPMKGVTGGVIDKTLSIHQSNVAIFNAATGKADRVGVKLFSDAEKKSRKTVERGTRVFRSSGEEIKV